MRPRYSPRPKPPRRTPLRGPGLVRLQVAGARVEYHVGYPAKLVPEFGKTLGSNTPAERLEEVMYNWYSDIALGPCLAAGWCHPNEE